VGGFAPDKVVVEDFFRVMNGRQAVLLRERSQGLRRGHAGAAKDTAGGRCSPTEKRES
jgi:hypothetical protein